MTLPPGIRLLAALLAVAVTFLGAPPAGAEPGEQATPAEPALASSPTLRLLELGASTPDLALYGQQGTATLTIPVPAGMDPASLNVTVGLPVYVRSASITVSQDERVLATVEVPPGPAGPLVIPLAGARVRENAVTVQLRSYLLPLDGYCLDPTNPLRLTEIGVTFAGTERPPTVVADFLPPVLRKLIFYVRPEPTWAEADAVVNLAAAIAARYGDQNPAIEVAGLPWPGAVPPAPAAPFERHIVISERDDTGVSLLPGAGGVPALLVSGPRNELINQTRLLTSGTLYFALSSAAVAGPLHRSAQLPANTTTIRQLGQPGVNASALNPMVGVALDQTRLGRSVKSVRVHLIGSYTPLPGDIGGQVVVALAGETLARWPAEPGGVIDRWVDVPDRLLKRYMNLTVQVGISGNTGRCGEFQPVTLMIDGESVVTSTPAAPPIPEGFQSLPQALMPKTQIGIESSSRGDIDRAIGVVVGLQRLSALPLDPQVVDTADAVASALPAVVIAPGDWTFEEIPLPLRAPDTVPTTINVTDSTGESTTLTLDPALRFGALEVVYQRGRTVLVATSNGAPAELDRLLDWLAADERRWSNLDGRALLSVPGRDPVLVPEIAVPVAAAGPTMPTWAWTLTGVLAGAALVGAAVLLLRRRAAGD